ncbi:hypothetical protein D3C75_944220 [compost metagenome]
MRIRFCPTARGMIAVRLSSGRASSAPPSSGSEAACTGPPVIATEASGSCVETLTVTDSVAYETVAAYSVSSGSKSGASSPAFKVSSFKRHSPDSSSVTASTPSFW